MSMLLLLTPSAGCANELWQQLLVVENSVNKPHLRRGIIGASNVRRVIKEAPEFERSQKRPSRCESHHVVKEKSNSG